MLRFVGFTILSGLLLLSLGPDGLAQQPPSYARDIKPFLARYCLECHNQDKFKGSLNLETYKGLREGGANGQELIPGKPDESRMVLLAEGKAKPVMPPRKARQPQPGEAAVLRAWIAAGAKDDTGDLKVVIPDIKPRVPVAAPVAALAYSPDGKLLAAGGHQEVTILEVGTGEVVRRLPGQLEKVTALTFNPDGRSLAVASGKPGQAGQVRLYPFSGHQVEDKPALTLDAHKDLVFGLAFSPDGKLLASCGYDRLIKLWDVATGKELRTLKDHSDAVYGLAFSPDGKLLASGAADRTVKVWEIASGNRLYTLSQPTDWVYAVAWSPDGQHLAAGGVDRSIRVWEVNASGGKIVSSAFAHEGPITRLIYSPDGGTLYSLGEDRTVKAWDAARLVEKKVYAQQPEAVLALAMRADNKQLALGRYDGAAVLLDAATGQTQAEPLPVKPKPPQLTKISPGWGQRGVAVRVLCEGKYLDQATELTTTFPGVSARLLTDGRTSTQVPAELSFPANTPAGVYQLSLKGSAGQTASLPFTVDCFPQTPEKEPNDSPGTGQKISLPATLVGAMDRAGDLDFYGFDATAGQQIGVQVLTTAVGSKLEPVLQLLDPAGRVAAESQSGGLGYTCGSTGTYTLGIRDREYRGGEGMHYRLQVGDLPVVTAVFPLGLQRGSAADIRVEGVNLGMASSVHIQAPPEAAPGTKVPIPWNTSHGTPLNRPTVVVGEFPEIVDNPSGARGQGGDTPHSPEFLMPVPGTANGRIGQPGVTDTWRFVAKKGQRLILEVEARRLGSPLDSYLEILDSKGQPVPRAILRCQAKTSLTFADRDSASPGLRLEEWSGLAINDYLFIGGELIRIQALPRTPDDDAQFYSVGGQRLGFLDTTPTFHSVGSPMYKVAIHPPGTVFPPNSMPVFTLYYRNDDGGPGYGKDSRIFFDPPADGDYQVRIGDARGEGGSGFGYRLTIRPPRPSFQVSFSPTAPAVWKGNALPITVTADRIDGFEGAIQLQLENVPPGFSAPAPSIPEEETTTAFALWADPMAKNPEKVPPLKLVARAVIDGKEVVREVAGGMPKVVEPGDIVTSTEQSEVTVRPGSQVAVTAKIQRRNGFAGRVPLEVRGLPLGVRVLDIGLNGILITEKESSRTFVLYCEPWVKPMTHPFVVLAQREGQGKEYAAKAVMLTVVP